MITADAFWMGRKDKYVDELSVMVQRNAAETLGKVNTLLSFAEMDGIYCNECSSGWRPSAVNDATANAAKNSKHKTGQAVDVTDPDRRLAQWCIMNLGRLDRLGLWMEDPRWTPTWVHFQTVPPSSGRRVFIPSTKPPLAPALVGQASVPAFIKV